jgi:GNAT superfamily N-acetyltransferase
MPIRPARADDFARLPAVETEADEVFRDTAYWPLPPADTAEEMAGADAVFVAGDPPVGFISLYVLDGEAYVAQLSVVPAQTRRGLGGALLAAGAGWALARGLATMTLTTFRDVPCNAPFYAKHGFAVTEDLGPELRTDVEAEVGLGLTALGVRVAMRKALLRDA